MPITYHYRNRSPDSVDDLLASPQQEPFQDDSIVLSDLVRAGETSRLRRRGAMRIEPTGASSSRQHRLRSSIAPRGADDATNADSPGYTWTIVENRSRRIPRHLPMLEVSDDDLDLEDSDSDSGEEMVFSASFNRAISEQTGHPIPNQSGSLRTRSSIESEGEKSSVETIPYSLVCGGPVDDIAICAQSDPESVSHSTLASFILPQPPQSSSSPWCTSSRSRDTNGCGAVVHTRAFPRYRHHQPMWTANTPAAETVVPLERMYFDDICAKEKLSPKMIKQETCGCMRIGLGCANCGNPLGFRLTPCKTLHDSIYSSRRFRSHRRSISQAQASALVSKSGNDDPELHLYTFFCSSTASPQTSTFPTFEPTSRTRRDRSRPRNYPLLPPPPPLIRLLSDSEMSDSDEEVIIDFRAPDPSSLPSRILGGDITASPEPTVIRLEPNPLPFIPPRPQDGATENATRPEDTELGQAMASWANVVRGIEATASSLGEDVDSSTTLSGSRLRPRRPRGPERRGALGFDAEGELGLRSINTSQPQGTSSNPSSNTDIPSILFEEAAMALTPPREDQELSPNSTSESDDDGGQSTPRAAAWGLSFADGHPSTSFWGRPAPGSNQWTWSNELAEAEREREGGRGNGPSRVFDPDGEFLEGLDGEWGEDMARQLGFSSVEEKSDGSETPTAGPWWP